ncbi:MAG: AraC family transcriptional regulator [Leptolyngbya sp. SIO4C1]|nr:AraC family transcriptional regulator [Leptolyngbya sp. SIO4C1]
MPKEQAILWRVQDLNNIEVLKASYYSQTFTRHTHDGFGLGIVEQGQLQYGADSGEPVISPGEMVVINPGQVHWGGAASSVGYAYRIFYPDCAMLSQALQSIRDADGLPHFSNSHICDRALAHRLWQLLDVLEDSSSLTLQRESYLMMTLTHLITYHADTTPALAQLTAEKQAVRQVRDYLHDCYGENVSLQTLANQVQLKPLQLLRSFRKAIGLPPHAYLLQIRINQAKALLRQGDPIVEVAGATGFADQSHLTRHFKRFVGVTPGQYSRGCRHR